MEYISKEARWRALYRTLPQWVGLIRQASNCSAKKARRQILDGLFDGQFAARWGEQSKAPFRDPYDPDLLPREGNFWRKAQINWRNGKVFDGWREEEVGPEYWRVLLLAPTLDTVFEGILRSSIPASTRDVENAVPLHPSQAPTLENAHHVRRGSAGRKPGSGSSNDEAALREMLNLLAAGREPSVLAAAKAVAKARKPNQSVNAEVGRLRRKFAKRWGTKPPEGETWPDVEHQLDTN